MSIYPVRLSEWYPLSDEHFDTILFLVKVMRCLACDKRCRYSKVIGHHSLPWGHGDIWCSEKCLNSNKRARPDKRRERRYKRKYREFPMEVKQ